MALFTGAMLGSSILGAAGSLFNNTIGSLFGNNSAKKQFEYQRQLNQEAFQHDVDMWNRQNEYNTPTAQMQRLQAAGLNPNLVYGNGGATNTATGAPTYNAGHAPDVGAARAAAGQLANQGFNTMLNMQLQQAQAANLNADTNLKNKTSELSGVQKEIALLDKELRSGTLSSEIQYKVEKWKQDLILGRNQIKLGDQQVTLNQKQMEKLDAETENIKQNTKLSEAQAEEIGIQILFLPELLRSQINLNSANAFNAIQSGNEHIASSVLKQAQTRVVRCEESLKRLDIDIKTATVNDVIRSVRFKSLSEQEQYDILYDFGWLQAVRKTFGADGSAAGNAITSLSMLMGKAAKRFDNVPENPRHFSTKYDKTGRTTSGSW